MLFLVVGEYESNGAEMPSRHACSANLDRIFARTWVIEIPARRLDMGLIVKFSGLYTPLNLGHARGDPHDAVYLFAGSVAVLTLGK